MEEGKTYNIFKETSMETLRILQIMDDTTADGPGFRTSIYCAGCGHSCPGCHNPQTWDFQGGVEMTVDEIMERIKSDPFCNVTFSGGDPMYQAEGFAELAERIKKETKKNLWCYTGFTFETCLRSESQLRLLRSIDVLVDGPFVERLRDTSLRFRGSSNQRIIDAQASLREGHPILLEYKVGLGL